MKTKKDWQGNVYNRNDYIFPRSSKEAFGEYVTSEEIEDRVTVGHGFHVGDVLVVVVVASVAIIVYLIFFGGA